MRNMFSSLTWPGRGFDQIGTAPSVEQGHCTLIAVKRYRDPPRIGGRHNFFLPDNQVIVNSKLFFNFIFFFIFIF